MLSILLSMTNVDSLNSFNATLQAALTWVGLPLWLMAAAASSVFFKNPAGQLVADPAGFLRMSWSAGPRTLADTQGLLTQMAHGLRQRGWGKVLADQLLMPSFSPAEQQWISQEWLAFAVRECGYRQGAIVVSSDTYARLATAFITTNVQGLPLRYRSFDHEAEAISWLLKAV